jgi:hypothetical protein
VAVVTLPAVTENVADVEPCETIIEDGTLAAGAFDLDSNEEFSGTGYAVRLMFHSWTGC